MNLQREITVWDGDIQPNTIYLFNETNERILAYLPISGSCPVWLKKPMRLYRRGRQFKAVGKRETEIRAMFEL